MPFQTRSFTEKDLPNLVKLLNEANKNAYELKPHSSDGLKSWIQDAGLQILMAVENGEVVGSIAYHDGHWGEEIEWLVAVETSRRRIIEEELVKEVEKCAKRDSIFTVVDAGSPKIDEWIQRGYKPEGGLYHMIARLDGVKPIPQVQEGFVLRSLKPNEEKEFVEAVNAGFGWERVRLGVIQLWKDRSPIFNEEWIHVACYGDRIVSAVVSRPDVEYNAFFKANRGYLGPASTLPEFRGKHLASALTCRAMNFLFEKGMDSVALYTAEQNVPSVTLLQKLGFRVAHSWKFVRKNFGVSKTEK